VGDVEDDDVHDGRLQWDWRDSDECDADVGWCVILVHARRGRLHGVAILRHERVATDVPWRVSRRCERLLELRPCVCVSIWCLHFNWVVVIDDVPLWCARCDAAVDWLAAYIASAIGIASAIASAIARGCPWQPF
jgi:hypothetical protein